MKVIAILAVLGTAMATTPAEARGCISGALVGGAAGHLAHHGLLGAAAGCAYGLHRSHQQQRMQMQQQNRLDDRQQNRLDDQQQLQPSTM